MYFYVAFVAFARKLPSSRPGPQPRKCPGEDGWHLDRLAEQGTAGPCGFSLGAGPPGFPVPSASPPPPPARSAILSWCVLCQVSVWGALPSRPLPVPRCSPFSRSRLLDPERSRTLRLTQDLWAASPGASLTLGRGVCTLASPLRGRNVSHVLASEILSFVWTFPGPHPATFSAPLSTLPRAHRSPQPGFLLTEDVNLVTKPALRS